MHVLRYRIVLITILSIFAASQKKDQVRPTNKSHPTDQHLYFTNSTPNSYSYSYSYHSTKFSIHQTPDHKRRTVLVTTTRTTTRTTSSSALQRRSFKSLQSDPRISIGNNNAGAQSARLISNNNNIYKNAGRSSLSTKQVDHVCLENKSVASLQHH